MKNEEDKSKADLTNEIESAAKAILDKVNEGLAKKKEEEPTEEKAIKVVSPWDALKSTEDKMDLIVAKDFNPDNVKRYVGLQTNEDMAKAKSALFWRAAIGLKMFPQEQAFYHTIKALSEGLDSNGGYLVNPEFRLNVIRALQRNGIMRPEVNVIPTTSDSVVFNKEEGRPKVTWGSENTTISTTTASLSQKTINVFRMNALMYLSREVVADSNPSIMDWIQAEFVDSVMNEEDAVIIGGNGTTQPKGITGVSGFATYDAGASLTFADYLALIHTLPIQYRVRGNAKFYMNDLALRDAMSITDTQGRPIYLADMTTQTPGTIHGYPVVVHNNFSESTVFFGDMKSTYYLIDRQQMAVETSTEAGSAFAAHQVAMKVTERIGGDVVRTEGLVKGTGFSA